MSSPAPDETGAQIQAAANGAPLPPGVVQLGPPQIIASVDEPGTYEAVVRICSEPIDREQLVVVGNIIAKTIYSDPSHESLSVLVVTSWVPDGAGSVETADSIRTRDYSVILWDSETAPPNASAWE
ncbi:hypothetical protein HF576_01765 [Microbacterium sp. CFH 90308]|uniref:Uncharacterized protein n=1 Tax=Microbacterium salsuginis TaxID=2722803 RepID=A0ABX1KAX7_9MICO|nr:hypothetical protein [Microbacterium sp. CFH 90308]NLP82566.1 hypothetical protein [Microbacterium sp. CFH 90308]